MLGVICHGIFLYNYTLLKVLVSRYDISVTSVLFQKKKFGQRGGHRGWGGARSIRCFVGIFVIF